ncbi:MAG: 30S ribosomal protein S10 [Rickettsiaceae bacterium]
MNTQQDIKIKLVSFDHSVLEQAAHSVYNAAKRTGADVLGPIPLPRHLHKFTVNTSPHVYKDAREQFEIRTYTALVVIRSPTSQTVSALKKLELSAGVDIDIKLN